jgi:hypothetical protein
MHVQTPDKKMNKKQRKTLELVFKNPVQSNIKWTDIESLFENLGAQISEGNGSRVRIALNGIRAVFHRPHPKRDADKGAVMSVRKFLINAEVKP